MNAFSLMFILMSLGAMWQVFALCAAIAQGWGWVCEITGGEEHCTL